MTLYICICQDVLWGSLCLAGVIALMERILMLTMLHLMLNWPRFNYHDRWSLQRTCKKYLPPVL
ncbi:hypothetical protein FOMPIDRAFT_1025269, partial [Fomitopsis schrenkii]